MGAHRFLCLLYRSIGNCARFKSLFDQAINLYMKSLQFSWLFKLPELEIQLYEDLGFCYFKLRELEKARMFHDLYRLFFTLFKL